MRISTATSVYVNYSIEDTIQHIANAGYDGIDIWGGRPHIYRHDYSAQQLHSLRSLITEYGLSVPSLMPAFYRYPHSLTNPNEIVRQDSIDYMRECMDNAIALGAEALLIVPGRSLYDQEHEDAWNRMADSISTICTFAEQHKLQLALEPVNRYVSDIVNTAADGIRMIEQVGYENLSLVLDTGHINLSQEAPQDALTIAGDRLLQVHINDNNGTHQQNLIPGEGTFDFKGFFQGLHHTTYDGFLTVELAWEYTLDPDPAVIKFAKLVREML